MPIALYIHIPFCVQKCAYCDFTSYPQRMDGLPVYLDGLHREIREASARYDRPEVSSIFIGGGTPSLLSGDQMQALMDELRRGFSVLPDAEISVEVNPGTLDAAKLIAYRRAGLNRLSMGVQAMQPDLLKMLGRIHRWQDAVEGVRMARAAGFENINLDLMYALPGQTLGDWCETLRAAIQLAPEHISAYSLIMESGTPLAEKVDLGELHEPDEDMAIEMQRMATQMLGEAGLLRYEISNYAREGYECRHNICYWTRGDYLGLGTAAHSLMRGERFANSNDPESWDVVDRQTVTPEDAFEERVMLGTRMVRGIDMDGINPVAIGRLVALGLIETGAGMLRLTQKGMELHNQVVLQLLS